MKKLSLIIAIVFSGMLVQAQDTVIMKNDNIFTGKVQVLSGRYTQIISKGMMREVFSNDIKEIKYGKREKKDFEWDIVTRQSGTKEHLFSKAKVAISNIYNSSTDVIKNSDKDLGIIQIKAKTSLTLKRNMGFAVITYYYDYSLILSFKDGRYRMELNGVTANGTNDYRWTYPQVSFTYQGMGKTGVSRRQHQEQMELLQYKLNSIINRIGEQMNQAISVDNDW